MPRNVTSAGLSGRVSLPIHSRVSKQVRVSDRKGFTQIHTLVALLEICCRTKKKPHPKKVSFLNLACNNDI